MTIKYAIVGAGAMGREHIRNIEIIDEAEVVALSDTNSESLRYLEQLGLMPGTDIQVTKVTPFDGPITAQVNNEQIVVGHKAADNVYIKKQ